MTERRYHPLEVASNQDTTATRSGRSRRPFPVDLPVGTDVVANLSAVGRPFYGDGPAFVCAGQRGQTAGFASAGSELVISSSRTLMMRANAWFSLKLVDLSGEFLDSVGCLGEVVAELAFVVETWCSRVAGANWPARHRSRCSRPCRIRCNAARNRRAAAFLSSSNSAPEYAVSRTKALRMRWVSISSRVSCGSRG